MFTAQEHAAVLRHIRAGTPMSFYLRDPNIADEELEAFLRFSEHPRAVVAENRSAPAEGEFDEFPVGLGTIIFE